jgi:thiol:disulfide interchange protein
MGTALTYALTQSALSGFIIFSFLGLGMALPMIFLSAFPALLRFLPKPGPWMNAMKRAMGVLMLLSALWLSWVLALQLNVVSEKNQWRSYSPQLTQELQRQNKDYFLDFTAAWCLTCQVNDRLVLQNPKVVEKFKEHSIILVKADWTKHDPAVTAALQAYGRNSIPLYVWYASREGKERILGETVTVQELINILDQKE